MAYLSKLQVIQRGGQNRQYYLICPAPLAAALEMEKGEELEWVIKDRKTFEIRRVQGTARAKWSRQWRSCSQPQNSCQGWNSMPQRQYRPRRLPLAPDRESNQSTVPN